MADRRRRRRYCRHTGARPRPRYLLRIKTERTHGRRQVPLCPIKQQQLWQAELTFICFFFQIGLSPKNYSGYPKKEFVICEILAH